MRLTILAVGRLKSGAETELVDRYVERAAALGRRLGLALTVGTIPESRAARATERLAEEAAALRRAIPEGAIAVALDENGQLLTSPELAAKLDGWRSSGQDIAFLIGGADGLGNGIKAECRLSLSFGRLTWPHQLARAMLAEQIYRAATIIANHPYHRGDRDG